MRQLLLLALVLLPAVAGAQRTTKSKGYVTRKGTVVAPYRKTAPDRTKINNFSTKGNTNPYTGKPGTKIAPLPTPPKVSVKPKR